MGYPSDPKIERVSLDHREEARQALGTHLNKQFDPVAMKAWAKALENAVLGANIVDGCKEKYYSIDPAAGRPGKGWEEIGLAWSKWKQLEGELLSSQE